jgi:hypothetical protein
MSKSRGSKIPRLEQSWEEWIYEKGRDARDDGTPRERCPFLAGAQLWEQGWDDRDREIPKARAAAE